MDHLVYYFFPTDLESLHGSVVGVHHELGERGKLRRPVPAVAAVDQRVPSLKLHVASDHRGTLHSLGVCNQVRSKGVK